MTNRKITIEMTTGNEAFINNRDVAEVLRELVMRIYSVGLDNITTLKDVNGNTVGTVKVESAD